MNPLSTPDVEAVARIIRQVALAEIMPRFRALAVHEISEKSPGQVVTIADTEAEKALAGALTDLHPGCAVLGEEGFEENPDSFRALSEDKPVWVLDPVDGTQNFADGKPCFAVIVAYCLGGETIAGWIHDPVNGVTIHGVKGQGAWQDGKRLKVAPAAPLGDMNGSLASRLRRRITDAGPGGSGALLRMRCVGREYMDLAMGRLHFARYGGKLKPWDHAAGVLIHAEAGGYSALAGNNADSAEPYRPATESHAGALILAPDRNTWRALHAVLTRF